MTFRELLAYGRGITAPDSRPTSASAYTNTENEKQNTNTRSASKVHVTAYGRVTGFGRKTAFLTFLLLVFVLMKCIRNLRAVM